MGSNLAWTDVWMGDHYCTDSVSVSGALIGPKQAQDQEVTCYWLYAPLSNFHRNEWGTASNAVSSCLYTSIGSTGDGETTLVPSVKASTYLQLSHYLYSSSLSYQRTFALCKCAFPI